MPCSNRKKMEHGYLRETNQQNTGESSVLNTMEQQQHEHQTLSSVEDRTVASQSPQQFNQFLPHGQGDFYWSSVVLIVLTPSLGDFLFGLDIGLSSFAINSWKTVAPTSFWIGWLLSATAWGAFGASFLLFRIADRMGRRYELRVASLCFVGGACLQIAAAQLTELSHLVCWMGLLSGRWLYGVGVAFALHGATSYIGEMSPSHLKGPLMSMNEISLLCGILSGYCIGNFMPHQHWGGLYAMSLLPSSIMVYLSWKVIPESARWLLYRNKTRQAQESLRFLYKQERAEDMEEREQSPDDAGHRPLLASTATSSRESQQRDIFPLTPHEDTASMTPLSYKELFQPKYRKALRAGLGVVAFLQLTGQPTVLAYASPLLQSAGLSSSSTVWVGIFKIVMTLVAMTLVEHQGRKKLLMVGTSIMLLFLVILSYVSSLSTKHSTITLISMFGFLSGYQIGFGTIVWLLTLEVMPMAIRGPAVALAVQTNFGLHAVVEFCVPMLQEWLGVSAVFGVFGLASAVALYFIQCCVPETKGLSLEEIEQKLQPQEMTRPP